MAFRSTGTQKIFQKKFTQQGIAEDDLLWYRGGRKPFLSSGKLKLKFVRGQQKAADYVKMLNDLSLAQEGHRLCGKEWIFQQDNADIHNASITKKYSLEQKIRLFDHPACSPYLNPIENGGGDCCKSLWSGWTTLGNFWSQKRNLRCMGKYIRFNFWN